MKIQKLAVLCILLCLLCAGCTEPQTDESAAVSETSSEAPIDSSPIRKPDEPLVFCLEPLYYYGEDDLIYIEENINGKETTINNPYFLPYFPRCYAWHLMQEGYYELPSSFEMTPPITATIMGHDYTGVYEISTTDQYQHRIDRYYFSVREGDTFSSFNYDVKRQKVVGFRFWFAFPEEYYELTTIMDVEEKKERCLEAVKTQTGIREGWVESEANRNISGYTEFLFSQYQHNVRVANVLVKADEYGRVIMMDWSGVGDFPNVRVPDWEEEYYLDCVKKKLISAYQMPEAIEEVLEVKDFAIVSDSMYYLAVPELCVDTVAFTVTYTTVQADGTEIERDALFALAYQPHKG